MARVLAGTVEVNADCALQWTKLLGYVREAERVSNSVLHGRWSEAQSLVSLLPSFAGEPTFPEYRRLRAALDIKGDEEVPDAFLSALDALKAYGQKVSRTLVKDVVDCECAEARK